MQDILQRTLVKKGAIAAFVELHIEQGPLLEQEGLQLGIVSAIAAPAALRVRFSGGGGHAGALLMPYRCAGLFTSKCPCLRKPMSCCIGRVGRGLTQFRSQSLMATLRGLAAQARCRIGSS